VLHGHVTQVMEKSDTTCELSNKTQENSSHPSNKTRKNLIPIRSVGALKCVGVLPGIGNCNSSSEDSSSEDEISVKSEVVRWKSFVSGQGGKVFVDSLGRKLQFAPANKKN